MAKRAIAPALLLTATSAAIARGATPAVSWPGYAHDAQHTAISPVASQSIANIHWQTPVDLDPQYSGDELFTHYGSPLVTAADTVIVPVKTGADGGFKVEGRTGTSGSLLWTQNSDYILPQHSWTPPFAPTLTPSQRLYFPAAGGTLSFRDAPDSSGPVTTGRTAFFGDANYAANPSGFNNSVFINTPITSDASGNLYFGYSVSGTSPLPSLGTGGIARISSSGVGTFTPASTATADASMIRPALNCAPALSNDGSTLYIAISNGASGYLVGLNSTTLAPVSKVFLTDPKTGNPANLNDNGTSAPTVGPDGTVFYGTLENPFATNNFRGYLFQFTSALASNGRRPGAFGWDITPSVVPASMVPSYTGTSTYLLMTKYNNYKGAGSGDGNNRIAILDPNDSQLDPISGIMTMKEVLTIAGPTPDPTLPAVKEWCINSAAVDPATDSILVNNEDGKLYRWVLSTNTLSEAITLTPGLGEAYTPTLVGPDGTVFAINNATLFAVGMLPPGVWNRDESLSAWSTPASWASANVPNAAGATATFGSVLTADRTVNIDSPQIVGTINFDNPHSYTLAGASITIDTTLGGGAVNVVNGSHTISAALVLNKDTTLTVTQAASTLTASNLAATGRNLTKAGAGTLVVNRVQANGLMIHAGTVRIIPNGGDGAASVLNALTIAGSSDAWTAQLDLADNDLVLHSTAANRVGDVARITNQLKQGLNTSGTLWTGNGIVTSFGGASNGNYTALGVTYNDFAASGLAPGPIYTTFSGQSVGVNDVLVKYTWFGDADLNGQVSSNDYFQIDTGFLANRTGWINGDFDYSGSINSTDYFLIDSAFLSQGGTTLVPTAVPEPSATIVLLTPLLALRRRKRAASVPPPPADACSR